MLPRSTKVLSGSSTVSFYPSDAIMGVVTSCKAAPTCRLCPKPSLGLSQFSGRSLTHCVTLGYLGLILTCCPVLISDLVNMALTSDLGSWVNPSTIFKAHSATLPGQWDRNLRTRSRWSLLLPGNWDADPAAGNNDCK